MNGLQHGLEQGLGRMSELASYLGLVGLVLMLGLAVIPFILWWNSSRANRLLAKLIEEQERTNALLEQMVQGKTGAPEKPDQFTLS